MPVLSLSSLIHAYIYMHVPHIQIRICQINYNFKASLSICVYTWYSFLQKFYFILCIIINLGIICSVLGNIHRVCTKHTSFMYEMRRLDILEVSETNPLLIGIDTYV